ncbi:nuclear respiratory factor 1-like [Actinia tenebrosa]|uniref:Nuclear respiratory factor 1-like n=1 Tax=Actinia tenebrosa TaxID=6105 RepID=A0A6P8HI43_ACTTE|nr:nuclear respiratory factor 1-like [Actinia tenebrosa]XP_031552292.1 nuclear respiratory factor 1-like [Actinia tenebrosa]
MAMSHSMSQSMTQSLSDEEPSSPESTYDGTDLLSSTVHDEVTAQLAAAGPVGVAAAAAIATGKKRKRPHSFETNPSIRKRQQTRLLRKLRATIDEYTTRVGQQAVVLCVCPGKPNPLYKVFGAIPLENVIRNLKQSILQDLENALAEHAPPQISENSEVYTLPPLVIDGIPTPVDKMTQAQLRAFIPMMLRYSTGRGKPGWGKESTRPLWWPVDLPWQNVRSDCRSEEQKAKVSWTNALRQIVKNCYKYHCREDLLPAFTENDNSQPQQYATHGQQMVHTISNADGTVSLIQVDASGAVSTISDGHNTQSEANQAVATLAEVAAATQSEVCLTNQHHHHMDHSDMSHSEAVAQAAVATLAEATLSEGGQIVLPEHAAAALAGVQDGMVTIPVQAAVSLMQFQGQMLSSGQPHYVTTSSVPQVAMAPHTIITVTSSNHSDSHNNMVDSVEGVPVATQAVEVVTLENAHEHMN